jgi:hypothetical protein
MIQLLQIIQEEETKMDTKPLTSPRRFHIGNVVRPIDCWNQPDKLSGEFVVTAEMVILNSCSHYRIQAKNERGETLEAAEHAFEPAPSLSLANRIPNAIQYGIQAEK